MAVVGGGPAGSLFASQLLRLARERGVELDVSIFERKEFLHVGPRGCNLCAGVVCSELMGQLAQMGISVDTGHTQRVIDGYWLQTRAGEFRVPQVDTDTPIVTVYRGNGPSSADPHAEISFDDLLLKHALGLGAKLVPQRVISVVPPGGGHARATVTYGPSEVPERFEADMVVVACGVNSSLTGALEHGGFGYRRPQDVRACQIEIPLDDRHIEAYFGNHLHLFALGLGRVRFAALTPKRGFVTLTLIGRKDLGRDDLLAFVRRPEFLAKLPAGWTFDESLCSCYPLMPVSPARNAVADRLAIIGDAAVSRFAKNGLGSAYTTATRAAQAIVAHGVSAEALRKHYWRPARRRIARDNLWGKALHAVGSLFSRSRLLAEIHLDVSYGPSEHWLSRQFHMINWTVITGDRPYWQAARRVLSPRFAVGLLGAASRVVARRVWSWVRPSRPRWALRRSACPAYRLGPLRTGQTVAVIGGGPAGASCAIALKRLAADRAMDLRVLLYEAKDLSSGRQFNACAGLVSPPIVTLLEEGLGVPFPHHLVLRRITEYLLCGQTESIRLGGASEPSLALRRVEFDRYLFGAAIERGVEVVGTRVTDLEISSNEVRIFSESGYATADVVVGAFGLDAGTGDVFHRATGYRRPACIHTLITKLHPPAEQMARHGTTAYALLPPIPHIEFAAVIPKGNHLTVIVAGRRLSTDAMDELLRWGPLRDIVSLDECEEKPPEYYYGRFPVARARHCQGDRFITVGDASGLVRPFKGKGVTTAVLTGRLAASTMMDVGIGRAGLRQFAIACRDLSADIFYGRLVRRTIGMARRAGAVDELIRAAATDEGLRTAMYCCASGEGSFRSMLGRSLRPGRIWRVARAVLGGILRGALGRIFRRKRPAA